MKTYEMSIPLSFDDELEKDARLICIAKGCDPERGIERLDTHEMIPAWRFFVEAAKAMPGRTGRKVDE